MCIYVSFRLAWSTQLVPGQALTHFVCLLHKETVFSEEKKEERKEGKEDKRKMVPIGSYI